jgi:hypothetical protein
VAVSTSNNPFEREGDLILSYLGDEKELWKLWPISRAQERRMAPQAAFIEHLVFAVEWAECYRPQKRGSRLFNFVQNFVIRPTLGSE